VDFVDLENLIAARLGFDIETIGRKTVLTVLRRSMEEAGFSDPAEYGRVVARDPEAWHALVDRLVVPESWFFRDQVPFELAVDLVRTHIRGPAERVFRILACPCSTGEEPYSLVMAMLQAGVPPEAFVVEAVDVNRRALEWAQAAQFGGRSFRGNIAGYRAAYFDPLEGKNLWRLSSSVRSLVRFREGNVIAPDFIKDDEPYDAVFCRNLLIYLLPEARQTAIHALDRLLASDGVLVLGNTEAAIVRDHGFASVGPKGAFAFVRRRSRPADSEASVRSLKAPMSAPRGSFPLPATPPAQTNAESVPMILPARSVQESDTSLFVAASRLGDSGQLPEALELCLEYLRRVPGSAKGHFLLGVLHDALGHPSLAADSFRKTLYLDPSHQGALLHLALKREALGDTSGAELLRARARRFPDASADE
jgi:chemotaxis protein methyltransferase WspC